MNYSELDHEEKLVFVALAKLIVRADGTFSDAEHRALANGIARELGAGEFSALMKEAKEVFHDAADIREAAAALTRQEARAFLHAELVSVAASDDLTDKEQSLLDGIGAMWGVAS